ncbi:hypothetical protein APC19_17300 [Acinetobacter pittii]|uniref:hypothetical protein n=1 Tax=Acinetobacter pittii TaxID=48296 RepID=UPI00070BA9F0|nr:hypothetical protein [Acinetobacter pittii]KQF75507.1 hypothetical protein APC19_17300 [Acinetobacter pittii]
MNQYHIKVNKNNCAEILNKLGAIGYSVQFPKIDCEEFSIFTYEDGGIKFVDNQYVIDRANWAVEGIVDLSESELNDHVILHRNNVHDATHCDNQEKFIYLTSDQIIYYWDGEWINSAINKSNDYENYLTKSLTLIPTDQEITSEYKTFKVEGLEGLVDGKAALTAALAGETVQISVEPWEEKKWDTFNPLEDDVSTKVFFSGMSEGVQKVFFRIKPKTILINGVEVPAPFKPNQDESFYVIDHDSKCGYIKVSRLCHDTWAQFGVWRTEEEIKQVVAALRKVFEVQP